MSKIFVDKAAPFLPEARLKSDGLVWYIEFYELNKAGVKKRVRKTFDLNRLPVAARWAKAAEILAELNRSEQHESSFQKEKLNRTPILTAMRFALSLKCKSERKNTIDTYQSHYNLFEAWVRAQKLETLPVCEFSKTMALSYLDAGLARGIKNRTYNNYIINIRSLFTELVTREYLEKNPFSKLQKRKEDEPKRQAFDNNQKAAASDFIFKKDKQVFLAALLIANCGLRISELRRMRLADFDFEGGFIHLKPEQAKNWKRASITIPSDVIPILQHLVSQYDELPRRFFLFGQGHGHPDGLKAIGRNTLYNRHRNLVEEMLKRGLLKDIIGLTIYSWKDTGGLAFVKEGKVDILALQQHLRHESLDTTQRYLRSKGIINNDIRNMKGGVFPLPDIKLGNSK